MTANPDNDCHRRNDKVAIANRGVKSGEMQVFVCRYGSHHRATAAAESLGNSLS